MMIMAKVFESMTVPAQSVLPILLDAALKGTVVLVIAALLVLACRRRSAAARHAIWTLALLSCLVLPALAPTLPNWVVHVPALWTTEPAGQTAQPLFLAPGSVAELPSEVKAPGVALGTGNEATGCRDDSTSPPPQVASASIPPVVSAPPAIPIGVWLLMTWCFGVVLVMLPLVGGFASLRRLHGDSRLIHDGSTLTLLAQLAAELGLRRSVTLLQNVRRSVPMTWGLWRPVILLPLDSVSWSPERLRVVLLHELAHVKRWDCLTQLLGYLVRALYWFHPLAWLAVAQLRQEQERACDDAVLNAGSNASDYAEHLLMVTAGLAVNRMHSPVALAVSRSRKIERRLAGILDANRSRRPLTGRLIGGLTLAALCLLLPLASLRLQAARVVPSSAPAGENVAEEPPTAASAETKKLAEIHAKVLQRYVKSLNEKEITDAAIRGLLSALNDPYCDFLSPDQAAQVERSLGSTFAGIGVQIRMEDDQPMVISPLEDSPALEAGLKPGDIILAIDGQATKGVALPEVVKRILGRQGSAVKLKVRHRTGEEAEVAVTRRQIKVLTVKGFRRDRQDQWEFLLDPQRQIGYVQIAHFTSGTVDDLRRVLQQLTSQGLKGLVLDLRCCPGGLLSAAIESTQLFLAKGTIVAIKGHQHEQVAKADGKCLLGDLPLVVLLNGQTASAGEIVAGALKDNNRAILLGSRSFGKGSVQELIKLDGGGTLRLTTAYYYLPSGRGIHRMDGDEEWGVDPTDGYYLPLDAKQTETMAERMYERALVGKKQTGGKDDQFTPQRIADDFADPQLAAALQTMITRITTGSFAKVGKGKEALAADLANIHREEIQKRRDALLKNLEQVNKELADLDEKSRQP
jgi:carboxyl-terminal processing protease